MMSQKDKVFETTLNAAGGIAFLLTEVIVCIGMILLGVDPVGVIAGSIAGAFMTAYFFFGVANDHYLGPVLSILFGAMFAGGFGGSGVFAAYAVAFVLSFVAACAVCYVAHMYENANDRFPEDIGYGLGVGGTDVETALALAAELLVHPCQRPDRLVVVLDESASVALGEGFGPRRRPSVLDGPLSGDL